MNTALKTTNQHPELNNIEATVTVLVSDLADLADLICNRDSRKYPPTLENIGACHELIIKMMGEHASANYAPEE
jgi:hypothetical protein